ncbi:FecCD family ABC transporter permease [Naasia aerilata]|uniref:ABC transporter permease n=1 Tax=Naasia aerilata TaxID=1162966 RepID=A0ABM8GGP2_9MICO|nr:iron chelate uptake ABC transporter family permease subunit [Naasia aerilata]BDZ47528.1 ABC transporter permease [Naasia aerilata]
MLAAVLLAAVLVTLCVGERVYAPDQVIRALLGERVPGASFTVPRLRLPRALTGALVGLAFGAAGTIFQTLLRNALASPDIIGISAGASAAAVVAIAILGLSGPIVSAIAVASGILVALVLVLLAGRGIAGSRFVLIGIGVGALLNAVVSYALTRAGVDQASQALRWLTGSLNEAFWPGVPPLAIAVAVLLPAALLLAPRFGALQLGDDAAEALGVPAARSRLWLIVVAVGLVAVGTAATGPIAFVAFLSGPIAGRLVPGRIPLLPAALIGAVLVLVADLIGQHLLGTRFPVGVVTGAVGAPYLLWLLSRTNRTGGSL